MNCDQLIELCLVECRKWSTLFCDWSRKLTPSSQPMRWFTLLYTYKKIICIKRLKRGEHLTLSNAKGEKFVRDKTSWKVISEILFGICANRSPSKSQTVQVRSFCLVTFNDFREDKKPYHSIEIIIWCHIVFSDSSLCRIWAIKIAYFSEKQQLLSSAKGNSLLTRTTFTICSL